MYLGFDLSTSALKVLLIDEQQRAIASSYVPEPVRQAAYKEAWQRYQRLYQSLRKQ